MSCNVESYKMTVSQPVFGRIGFFGRLKMWIKTRAEQRTNRAAFQHVLSLEDDILKDIGVTRDDVNWANKLPIEQNASLELQRVAAFRNKAMF